MAITATVAIPTLDPDGWVYSSDKLADYLMAHALASDNSQSYLFKGNIISFGYLVSTFDTNNTADFLNRVQQAFDDYFSRYFSNVSVDTQDLTDPSDPSQFILGLDINYQLENGTMSNAVNLISIKDSKFAVINNVINAGGQS